LREEVVRLELAYLEIHLVIEWLAAMKADIAEMRDGLTTNTNAMQITMLRLVGYRDMTQTRHQDL